MLKITSKNLFLSTLFPGNSRDIFLIIFKAKILAKKAVKWQLKLLYFRRKFFHVFPVLLAKIWITFYYPFSIFWKLYFSQKPTCFKIIAHYWPISSNFLGSVWKFVIFSQNTVVYAKYVKKVIIVNEKMKSIKSIFYTIKHKTQVICTKWDIRQPDFFSERRKKYYSSKLSMAAIFW